MIQLSDYKNPFDAIRDFEIAVAEYAGAPYCVSTNCCTHAMEIALRLTHRGETLSFPSKTYLSVLMLMHKLNIPYILKDVEWRESYQIDGSQIWDCARKFKQNMYRPGQIQCLSFGRTKPLEIGIGGCLLTDNEELYCLASMMRSDGRDLNTTGPWIEQKKFPVGYHYTMRPEECVEGLNRLNNRQFTTQIEQYYIYPDCRMLEIYEPKLIF